MFSPPYQDNPANGAIYPSFVPKTDTDGNDVAGIRLPEVQVPLATYTGWAVRPAPHAPDGCEGSGQYIPFPKTKADRLASGDPRLSIEERYGDFATYSSLLEKATEVLVKSGFLLPVDAKAALSRNLDNVVKNNLLLKK
jgi:Alpha/beta hydrolase domain